MISIVKKEDCCGCAACVSACPKNCISLVPDAEGFVYPEVNDELCINCSLCERVCPINTRAENTVIEVFAAKNKDENVRAKSSSGGTFNLLSRCVLDKGGVVFGCAFDEDMTARHIAVETEQDLIKLQSSKYVQSDLTDIFPSVKSALCSGREVLFSGTPCQVAGLKNFLNKDYQNLLTVDLLCHGVPSPRLFADYKTFMESKFGAKMVSLNLRDKKKSWKRLFVNADFENGKNYFKFCGFDPYLSVFLNNISLRPSCFECRFTTENRVGDITLGDFWGIGKHIRQMDDDKGTSLIITNTEKGVKAFAEIKDKMTVVKTDIEMAADGNKVLVTPTKKNKNRDAFYELYKNEGFEAAAEKYAAIPSKPKQIYYTLMRKALDIYRFIFRKSY